MERTPVRLSLLRRISWLGGDRRLVGMAGLLSATLGYTMFTGFGIDYGLPVLVPVVLFFVILWVARAMYAADPWMIDVGLRHLKYGKYYAPKSSYGKEQRQIRDFVK
jgi:type IV secretory pathway TrbD component